MSVSVSSALIERGGGGCVKDSDYNIAYLFRPIIACKTLDEIYCRLARLQFGRGKMLHRHVDEKEVKNLWRMLSVRICRFDKHENNIRR